MSAGYGSGRTLGTGLAAMGLILAVLGMAWIAANAASGLLEPGGFVLGLIFLSVVTVPLVLAGLYLRKRGVAEDLDAAGFEQRRRLFERDRIFRQLLQRESHLAGGSLEDAASRCEGEVGEMLRQARASLAGLEASASEPVREAAWLEAAPLNPRDERNVARYDDLLLAGIRRIREAAGGAQCPDPAGAQELLRLAQSAERQFSLRQDLVLRGRSLPASSPLRLMRGEDQERGQTAPESLRPGAAVSRGADDYLVTARLTYFAEGREWFALALSGADGERRLQVGPGSDEILFMEPAVAATLGGNVEDAGTASVSVDGLGSSVEGVVVDYRRTRGDGGAVGWWERWPEGERAYTGSRARPGELQLWPSAVAAEE